SHARSTCTRVLDRRHPTMRAHDVADHGEADSASGCGVGTERARQSHEPPKYTRAIGARNSGPLVVNGDDRACVTLVNPDAKNLLGPAISYRVIQGVEQHLPHRPIVG